MLQINCHFRKIKPRYENDVIEPIVGETTVNYLRPHRLARSRTPDFHSDNRGSNPLGVISNDESLAQLVRAPHF